MLQGHEVDAALTADVSSGDLRVMFDRLMASGAAWLNETYAILSVNPTTGMMLPLRTQPRVCSRQLHLCCQPGQAADWGGRDGTSGGPGGPRACAALHRE